MALGYSSVNDFIQAITFTHNFILTSLICKSTNVTNFIKTTKEKFVKFVNFCEWKKFVYFVLSIYGLHIGLSDNFIIVTTAFFVTLHNTLASRADLRTAGRQRGRENQTTNSVLLITACTYYAKLELVGITGSRGRGEFPISLCERIKPPSCDFKCLGMPSVLALSAYAA